MSSAAHFQAQLSHSFPFDLFSLTLCLLAQDDKQRIVNINRFSSNQVALHLLQLLFSDNRCISSRKVRRNRGSVGTGACSKRTRRLLRTTGTALASGSRPSSPALLLLDCDDSYTFSRCRSTVMGHTSAFSVAYFTQVRDVNFPSPSASSSLRDRCCRCVVRQRKRFENVMLIILD